MNGLLLCPTFLHLASFQKRMPGTERTEGPAGRPGGPWPTGNPQESQLSSRGGKTQARYDTPYGCYERTEGPAGRPGGWLANGGPPGIATLRPWGKDIGPVYPIWRVSVNWYSGVPETCPNIRSKDAGNV
jgi:hypothetical protein